MKIRPILFSTAMVQAILAGRKTQTRRVVKDEILQTNRYPDDHDFVLATIKPCQYGQVGDVLWVRETCLWVMKDHAHDLLEGNRDGNQWVYKSYVHSDWTEYAKEKDGYKWKPSIFMPKAAARIFLKITNIRVERLNDISEDDAEKEGVEEIHPAPFIFRWKDYVISSNQLKCPIISFYTLWCSINGAKSWNENPFVWVIEFERIEKPENF